MDKNILSTAIMGVLAGSMAFTANADVTVYGRADLSIDAVDIDAAPGRSGDDTNMNSNNSRLGVKGSEDLGNGLKAIFQLEYGTDVSGNDSSASGLSGRDQWVGLAGGFGKARFGTAGTRYKDLSKKIDPLWDTSLEGRSHGLMSKLHGGDGSNGEGRMTNGIFFNSADYNGLELGFSYSLDDSCNATSVSAVCGADDDAYSLGASYANGPLYMYTSYVTSDKGGDDDATQVGGKYSFGDFGIYGHYEMDGGLLAGNVDTPNQSNDGADVWHLGGTFNTGNIMLYAGYGQGDDDSVSGPVETGYDAWTVGGTYTFSKRTMVYTGYNQVSCDEGGWSNTATNQCANVDVAGGDNSLFSLGMRHNF